MFDFDGTLTKPGSIDFAAVHEAIGCPRTTGLLEFLAAIVDPEERARKEAVLVAAEMEAAGRCQPNPGLRELIAMLREASIPLAVITRNRREPIERALSNLDGVEPEDFTCLVTRDLPLAPKPSPESVLHVARELGVEVGKLLMVGDHAFDIEAGVRAGALTMFLRNDPSQPSQTVPSESDFVVENLSEAQQVMRYGLPLPLGKLPVEFLSENLAAIVGHDESVLVGAAVGEDAAVVDVAGDDVLVLASDPVTLASDDLAGYLVLANANDVAACGASPRWFLSTLMFPRGTSASEVSALISDIQMKCLARGLTLCGGHTEITDAVSRPLVVGMAAGTARTSQVIDKSRMKEGDRLLVTKALAIEGTGLIAREFGGRLTKAGISAAVVAECVGLLDSLGILEEARIAGTFAGVSALHDVTEGGMATAVRELSAAGGHRLRVHVDRIPVYPQTERICEALGLDSLGLLGSGALLITCAADVAGQLGEALGSAGIKATDIGEVLGCGEGVEALRDGLGVEWPRFQRDEITRLER